MRIGQGVRTGLGHGGITCVLQTQFSSFIYFVTPASGMARYRDPVFRPFVRPYVHQHLGPV